MLIALLLLLSRADLLSVCFTRNILAPYFPFLPIEYHSRQMVLKYLIYWAVLAIMEIVSLLIVFVTPTHFWMFIRLILSIWLLNPHVC
jgi:hypothetical protein